MESDEFYQCRGGQWQRCGAVGQGEIFAALVHYDLSPGHENQVAHEPNGVPDGFGAARALDLCGARSNFGLGGAAVHSQFAGIVGTTGTGGSLGMDGSVLARRKWQAIVLEWRRYSPGGNVQEFVPALCGLLCDSVEWFSVA